LDLINGISFTKGCYPGQEVVARSHYRGTVKRRMAYGTAQVATDAVESLTGQDVFDANGTHPDTPTGRIINAAQDGVTTHLLIEVKLADMTNAAYRLCEPNGPAVTLEALPYDIQA